MDVRTCILKRRSIRKFKNDTISDEVIKILLESAMAAPSACNKQPWEFYVITSENKLKEIRGASRFARYDAPLAIVVCGNNERSLSKEVNDFWIQDCSAAIENILLSATSLNLGTVWCGLYPMETPTKKMKEVLEVGENIIPLGLIYIGYPANEVEPRTQYNEEYIHYL